MVSRNYVGALAALTLTACSAPSDIFNGRNVALFYETSIYGGGPSSREGSLPVPLNRALYEGALNELKSRGASVSSYGVFKGDYSQAIALYRSPANKGGLDDLIVIADSNPNLSGNLKDVYLVIVGNYNFKEATK